MKHNIEITMHIHAKRRYSGEVAYEAFQADMSNYGYTKIMEVPVLFDFEIPDDFSLVQAEIESLKEQKKIVQATAQMKITQLEEQIQSLQCIEYKEAA